MRMPTLLTLLALTGSASAAGTAAVHVFAPTGGTVPLGLSLTAPFTHTETLNLALRGEVLLFPGLGAPPALSALLVAEAPAFSRFTPYVGAGLGTASVYTQTGWAVHPTWTAVAGVRAAIQGGLGLSVEARASRAAFGVAMGLTLQSPTGSRQ